MKGYGEFKTYFTRMIFDAGADEFRPLWLPHPFAHIALPREECEGRETGLPADPWRRAA